ncbi:MAG: 30S ribosomal protein S19e [Thermoplasmata archaeon]|jgi:small subunit ribosomal protein S19e|nr:30S ribosomal protein S19e [Thermoplasmatales archaeon]PMP75256.1 MAG: 30S ribosomal protein S19e [Aciduliprofundum sp.]HEU12616.1 30S ribosomal protein S19e [Euryarchaeota archaeon]
MVTVYDVDPDKFLKELAERLKKEDIKPPEWAKWVKTGIHREKGPVDDDWWYLRLASVFRKIYVKGPIGTSRLSSEYGGKVDRGTKPYHAWKGSRSIVRKCLQQLEALGYVEKNKKGRVVSPKGRSYLDKLAEEIVKKGS